MSISTVFGDNGVQMLAPDSKTRFSSRVADYVKARPRYPQRVIEILEKQIGLHPSWAVADIGSGTGISAELFLANGNTVYAVEPNADMRAAAEQILGKRKRFRSIAGEATATTLKPHSVDLIVAAQAYHWFHGPAFTAEARRIAKPDAWFVAMWNQRFREGSPFQANYEALLNRFCPSYEETRNRWDHTPADFTKEFGTPFQLAATPNHQLLDYAGLEGRLMSSSYAPKPGLENHEPMLKALREIFDKFQEMGQVRVDYTTEMFFGKVQ
jgi:SAM-dependent methyltransferase